MKRARTSPNAANRVHWIPRPDRRGQWEQQQSICGTRPTEHPEKWGAAAWRWTEDPVDCQRCLEAPPEEGRLNLHPRNPSPEEVFAADQLRALAAEFTRLSEREESPDEVGPWLRAAAKAEGRARELDQDFRHKARVPLTLAEAEALSDLMDDHPDASYGRAWRSGRTGAIDWDTLDLVVDVSEWAGRLYEAVAWTALGNREVDPLLQSVLDKITRRRAGWRSAQERKGNG